MHLDDFLAKNPNHIITELADAGYYKSSYLLEINNGNVKAMVPKPKTSSPSDNVGFSKSDFTFNKDDDVYICPNNQKLSFSRKSTETRNGVTNHYKIYSSKSCLGCTYIDKCTSSINRRSIKRNVLDDKLLEIDNEYSKDSSLYKLRKSLVEHPFGTIKRSLGLTHVYVKGLDRISSWTSSVFLSYNLKRVINILGIQKLKEIFATN